MTFIPNVTIIKFNLYILLIFESKPNFSRLEMSVWYKSGCYQSQDSVSTETKTESTEFYKKQIQTTVYGIWKFSTLLNKVRKIP